MTWLARRDLRAKLVVVAGLLAAALAGDLVVLGLLLAAVEGLLLASGLAARQGALGLALLFSAPFVLLNAALYGAEPAAALGPVVVYREGLLAGLAFAARVAVSLGAGLWVLGTTQPREALRLLARWPRAALAAAGTLRFAPLAVEDWARVREAQALRGAPVGAGVRGAFHAAPLMVPLFVATVRRGHALGEALEASAFGSGPRTRAPAQPLRAADAALMALGLALLALAALEVAT